MTEATTQIKIGASLDGTFETTAKTGKRLISEIGTAARDAGKNTGEIGNGLSASAQKVEAATRNMIGSIQRQTAAMEAGDKASRKYQESLAKMRGIDVATLRPYLDQLDAAKAKQDASASSMAALKSAGVAAGYALAGAAAGFAAFTKSAIDSADAMNDMSQRVGIAVSDLAKYQLAAEQSGTSMEAISKGVKGLAGNLVEHGAALRKAGIDATNADGAMQQLADVFSSMPDGIDKTTLAVKLFGKSGMDLIPMLNLGSDGLAKASEKSAEFAVQMAALAPLADAFNDNIAELAMSSKTVWLTIANQLMPTLIALSGEMLDSKNGANALAESMGKGLNAAAQASIVLFSDVAFVLKSTGREMGALAAQYVAFMSLDFKGFSAIGDAVKFDAATARAELDAFQSRVLSAQTIAASSTYAQHSGVGYKAPGDAKALLSALGATEKVGRAAKSAADEFGKLNDEIAKSGALAAEQLSSGGALAESDKYRISILDKLIESYQIGKITLSQYIDLESKMTDVENTKRQAEQAKEALKIAEERTSLRKKEYEDAAAFGLAQTEYYNAQVKGSQEALAAAQAEYDQYGLSKSQIAEITLLTLESSQAKLNAGSIGYQSIQLQIDAQRELIGVLKNTEGLEAAKKVADAWKQTGDSIKSDITGAFEGAVMNGENLFDNLAQSVEKMFSNMVLRPIIEAGVSTAMDAVGLGSTASTASGIMGMANTGASLLSGTSSFSLGLQGTISTITEQGIIGGISNAFTSTTSLAAAGDFMGAIGAAMPYIGGALAIVGLLGSIGNDRLPSQGTGEGQLSFDATGAVTDSYSRFGEGDSNLGLTTAVNDTITALYTDYAKTAAALGIQLVETQFSFGSNTGLEGKDPQFAIGSNAGGVGFSSGEIQQTDEAVQIAASRAVFNALQQSELPKYLSGAFDGITASTATQEQITAALDGASALQSFHTQLQALPWDSLKDMTYATTQALVDMSGGLDQLQSNLGTYYDKFYTDSEKTSDLTAATADAFAALGITMPTATDGLRDWYRGLVDSVLALDQSDAANAGATVAVLALQTAVDTLAPTFEDAAKAIADYQEWQDKLDVLNGVTTERAQQQSADLAAAADDQTRALINQVYAAEDAAEAAQVVADSMQSLTDALKSMADETASVIASMGDIGKTDFQQSIAQIIRDGATNQATLNTYAAGASTATSATTYSAPASQSPSRFTEEQDASIKSFIAGLDWSAAGTAASSTMLLSAMTEAGVSLEDLSNLGYATADLKNVASFATAEINNALVAANPIMAYTSSNYSNWGGPAESGGSFVGSVGTGSTGSGTSASAADNTNAKLNAAYAEQLQIIIDSYKPDMQQIDALAALKSAGYIIDGLDAEGIKKYFYDIASSADPLTTAGKSTIDALDSLTGQIALLGQVASERQAWQDKLDVLTLVTTQRAIDMQRDLASTTDAATQSLIKQVYAFEDASAAIATRFNDSKSATDTAFAILQKSVNAQRDIVSETISNVTDIIDSIDNAVKQLRGEANPLGQFDAAQSWLDNALTNAKLTGYLPDTQELSDAISTLGTGLDAQVYASEADASFNKLVVAGKLQALGDIAKPQLTTAQQQLADLDSILDTAQAQLDALNGINNSVLSVADALANFNAATKAQAGATVPAGGTVAMTAPAGTQYNGDEIKSIQDLYTVNLGRVGDAAGMAYWAGQFMADGVIDAAEKQAFALASLPEYLAGLPMATGTNYVPYDGFNATLHEGEAVIPKAYNPAAGAQTNAKLESLVEALTVEVQRLQSIVNDGNKSNDRIASTLENVTEGGANMRTVAA